MELTYVCGSNLLAIGWYAVYAVSMAADLDGKDDTELMN